MIKASIVKFLMSAEIFFIFDIILVSVFHLMSLIVEDGRDVRPDSGLSLERKCSFHGDVNTKQDWYLKSHWYKGHIVIHGSASGGSHRLQRGLMRWGTKKKYIKHNINFIQQPLLGYDASYQCHSTITHPS